MLRNTEIFAVRIFSDFVYLFRFGCGVLVPSIAAIYVCNLRFQNAKKKSQNFLFSLSVLRRQLSPRIPSSISSLLLLLLEVLDLLDPRN